MKTAKQLGLPVIEEPEVKPITPATKVMKDLINERMDKMTFIQLALLLAYVIEKK